MTTVNTLTAAPAVAIANYDFRASGTVAQSMRIAAAAHEAGLPVELWALRAHGPLLARVPRGVAVVEVGSAQMRFAARALDLGLSLAALARALRQRRPAVLLSGGNHLHLAARAALELSGRRNQVRLGLRVSNSSWHRGPAHAANQPPGSAAMARLSRLKFAGADFVVAVSADLAAEVGAIAPGVAVECIENGCDVAAVRWQMLEPFEHRFLRGRGPGGITLCAMGRVTRQKGFDVLIRALAVLRRQMDARLLVVGSGEARDIDALRRLAARLGVAGQVDFLGHLANPFAVIARSDLFVCASRWEGSCNALIEALACNVPVVATDCPTGNAELLQGGALGTLAPVDAPAQLADAMVRELRTVRPAAEREAALARLDIGRSVDRWTALLRRESGLAGGLAAERRPHRGAARALRTGNLDA